MLHNAKPSKYGSAIIEFVITDKLHVDVSCKGTIHCEFNITNPCCSMEEGYLIITSVDDESIFQAIHLPEIVSIQTNTTVCSIICENTLIILYNDYFSEAEGVSK
jgi:hypothetical protein